jgi:hypothetical protein
MATSTSIVALFAQSSFPDGTGIVQTSCRRRIVRRSSSLDESARLGDKAEAVSLEWVAAG